jgi:Recombinase
VDGEPVPEEQATVALILELHERGLGLRTIAKFLNGQGAPPKSGRGRRWSAPTVASVIDRYKDSDIGRVAREHADRDRALKAERLANEIDQLVEASINSDLERT